MPSMKLRSHINILPHWLSQVAVVRKRAGLADCSKAGPVDHIEVGLADCSRAGPVDRIEVALADHTEAELVVR